MIHSMITDGLDVVNPYNFVDIFKSHHKSFDANECTYILDIVVLSYCFVVLFCHIVVLLYWVTVKIGLSGLDPNLDRNKHRINLE